VDWRSEADASRVVGRKHLLSLWPVVVAAVVVVAHRARHTPAEISLPSVAGNRRASTPVSRNSQVVTVICRTDLSLKCAHQYYQLRYFILASFFSLHGTVVSALRALLHPPRLL